MVVIESMAEGTPVIAAPMGGIPEIVGTDYLLLSRDSSADPLKNAVKKAFSLSGNEYRNLQEWGLARSEEYLLPKTTAALITLFQK